MTASDVLIARIFCPKMSKMRAQWKVAARVLVREPFCFLGVKSEARVWCMCVHGEKKMEGLSE
jgi:hypothetical protein